MILVNLKAQISQNIPVETPMQEQETYSAAD